MRPVNYSVELHSFWELLSYARIRMCLNPGCTTCGCMDFKKLCESQGRDSLQKMLGDITLEEIKRQHNLLWHDALEIIFHYFGTDLAEGTFILKEYEFVFNKYYELRRVYHIKPNAARCELLSIIAEQDDI